MKTQPETTFQGELTSLHQLVKIISSNARPSASRNNSFIVNEIPVAFPVLTDENILATTLSRLLYTLVNNAQNTCIRITASEYDDVLFVHIKGDHGFDHDAIDSDLQQAQAYAKKMNGNIGLNREDGKVTGVVFSFPNLDIAKKHAAAETSTSSLY